MLPIDVADRERATVGGVVATNAFGRRRQRYGTVKDVIVGVTLIRPDGTLARGGGKVVKNVAGFDLPKLMTGALGTLGAIASVTCRVHPIPEARGAAMLRFESSDAVARVSRAIVDARLEPESLTLYNYDTLVVTFGGTPGGVAEQMRTLLERVAPANGAAECRELVDDEPESYDQRERAVRRDGEWRFTIAAQHALPVWTLGSFVAAPPLAVPVAYPLLGFAFHAYAALGQDAPQQCADLRAHVATHTGGHGRVAVTAMPDDARGGIDAWGAPPPSLELMRALKSRFDPLGLCNPGRFVGGI
jgi:glycolate oxidase FAD binding subunit